MAHSHPFAQVDVFSSRAYHGNPLAVILEADTLGDDQMRAIARWTNLSETTFICGPTQPGADYRVRIFTPGGELPFAGHPTLGSAHAWLEAGGRPADDRVIVQQCAAGLVRVRRGENGLSFAAPPTIRQGPLDDVDLDKFVAALGIERSEVIEHQWVDNGPGWAVLQLATARQVLELEPDLTLIPDAMVGAIGSYPPGSEAAFEMRTFAPGVGVSEDPVCGSMNASVAQWLTRTEQVTEPFMVTQGARLGRAGEIHISTDDDGTVWVGGATTTLFRGEATI